MRSTVVYVSLSECRNVVVRVCQFIGVSAICKSVGQCTVSLSVRESAVYTLTCVSTWVGESADDTELERQLGVH